jgi:hypothetical protein
MKFIKALITLVLIWPFARVYADVYNVVVTNLDGPEIPAPLLDSISDTLRTAFIGESRFKIVERERLEDILEEQGLQISGCIDLECAVMVGKLVNATHVVVGKLLKDTTGYRASIRLLDIELGVINAEYNGSTSREEGLINLMREAARKVCETYQVKCEVVEYDGEYLYLPIGTANGVEEGSRFKLTRVTKTVKNEYGEVIFRKRKEVGICEVVYVEAAGSQVKMVREELEPEKGDLAELIIPE